VVERWAEAVGAPIARSAWPARVGRDGTLHVATADSTWAFELAHRAPEIAARLGVPKVRFAPGPLPEPGVREPPPAVARASVEHQLAAAEIAAPIADENLRKSVEKAVSLGLARASSDLPV
jgi:hypothetical protein